MSLWPSTRARQVYKALLKIGWEPVSQHGSHIKLRHQASKYPDYIWAFRDNDEIGPRMLARIAKHTGLTPRDL
ncbi:MAG: type II toxin-antitoxin system HicA family toxin [Candidatus Korobacteraceae bacterium]